MNPIQNLYYAMGEVAYSIVKAEGIVQKEEKIKLRRILVEEFKNQKLDFDINSIIFHILEKDGMDPATAYSWALYEMKLNSPHVSKKMKERFIHVIKKVAKEFPPETEKKQALITKFINDIKVIKEDAPVKKN